MLVPQSIIASAAPTTMQPCVPRPWSPAWASFMAPSGGTGHVAYGAIYGSSYNMHHGRNVGLSSQPHPSAWAVLGA
jgi:hypothetical protein